MLWAELTDYEINITFAQSTSKKVVRVTSISFLIDKTDRRQAADWIAKLLDRAYGKAQRKKRIKVLVNPFGGNGQAQKRYSRDIEPILAAARCEMDVERTAYRGHAVEIAEHLDADRYDVVASCSGDGLPHEVFNGLAKRREAKRALHKLAVVQFPCGTGNAMSFNLNGTDSPSIAAVCIVKGIRTPLDLTSITQGDKRSISFLSQSVGIVAEVDLGTDDIRWMGDTRFTYGFLKRTLGRYVYPCDVAVAVDVPTKAAVREHYRKELSIDTDSADRGDFATETDDEGLPALRFGTVNDPLPPGWSLVPYDNMGNFYCGNMAWMTAEANFFPASLPNDGHNDLVTINGDISRAAAIECLTAAGKGKFFDLPQINYRKISGFRIIPNKTRQDGQISIDGEKFPFQPFQTEVHPGLGTVLSRRGHLYEAPPLMNRTGK